MKAVFALALLALATATPWFAQYDLSEDHIQNLTVAGCYRGLYGGVANNGDPRTMSLLNCGANSSVPFADEADDATLCVVELFSPNLIGKARDIIMAHPLGARLLFVGRQELVISNPFNPEGSNLCCTSHFPNIAQNVIFVPTHPIRPQVGVERVTALAPNPTIQALIASISKDNIQQQVYNLATDTSGGNTGVTRNSYAMTCPLSKCLSDALNYVETTVRGLLADRPGVTYTRFPFRSDMGPNFIVRIPGTQTSDLVILGSHLDSRNNVASNTNNAAPGADDNGSGSAVNLEYVRVLKDQYFEYSLEIQWYVGEEQGLLGSAAIASQYKADGIKVRAMFNTDMIGWTQTSVGIIMAFMSGSANAALTTACRDLVSVYVPTLKTGTTSACCSDQQSWHSQGYPAIGIFETATSSVVYPAYHTTSDTIEKVNYEQLYQFAQGMLSCIAEYAVPSKPVSL